MIRLVSWNVNGIRASIKKGFWDAVEDLNSDVVCVQETKTDAEKMSSGVSLALENGYDLKFNSADKKGYSGVASFSLVSSDKTSTDSDSGLFDSIVSSGHYSLKGEKRKENYQLVLENLTNGLGLAKFDSEGRLVVTRYRVKDTDFQFTLINGYYPQGGRGQHRIDYKIEFYKEVFNLAQKLRKRGEKVILCGDFNTTFTDIDLARPKENKNNTGCLPEEREVLKLFTDNGFVDSYRHFYPDKEGVYTYWDQKTRARDRNVGWRIDYFLVDEKLLSNLEKAYIWEDIMGSDHCPIGIDLKV